MNIDILSLFIQGIKTLASVAKQVRTSTFCPRSYLLRRQAPRAERDGPGPSQHVTGAVVRNGRVTDLTVAGPESWDE